MKPKRKLRPHKVKTKESAKKIVKRINDGEEVAEITNLLESYLPLDETLKVEEFLLLAGNLEVFNVTKKDRLRALKIAKEEKSWIKQCNSIRANDEEQCRRDPLV